MFALHLLFLCVILHTMWSGKSLKLLCILSFGMVCLSAISMMFVKIMLAVCMVVGAKANSVSSVQSVWRSLELRVKYLRIKVNSPILSMWATNCNRALCALNALV